MDEHLQALIAAIGRWRAKNVQDYWLQVDYVGSALNRLGNHTLTHTGGKLWHLWHDDWREIETGSDFWLFSVPGSFAWVRDMAARVLPEAKADPESLELHFNDEYGYVEHLRVRMPERDATNFTFDIKKFGEGPHPEFNK